MSDEAREPAGMKVSHKLPPLQGRVACDVLQELRDCFKSRDFSSMRSKVEELQAMFDRMEEALAQYGNSYGGLDHVHLDVAELKKEKRQLKGEIYRLKRDKVELEEQKASDTDDLEAVGSAFINLLRDEMEIPIGQAGAFFKKMRKAGLIIYKQKDNKDE